MSTAKQKNKQQTTTNNNNEVAALAATRDAADAASVITANKQTPATLEEMMGELDAAGDAEGEADFDF